MVSLNQHYVTKQYILILHYFPTVKFCFLVNHCLSLFVFFLMSTLPPSFQTDTDKLFWDDPRKVGIQVTHEDGSTYHRGPGAGTAVYLTHLRAKSRDFIKGGDAIFLLTMEGKKCHISFIRRTQSGNKNTCILGLTLYAVLCAFCDPVMSHLLLVRCFSSDSESAYAHDPISNRTS